MPDASSHHLGLLAAPAGSLCSRASQKKKIRTAAAAAVTTTPKISKGCCLLPHYGMARNHREDASEASRMQMVVMCKKRKWRKKQKRNGKEALGGWR